MEMLDPQEFSGCGEFFQAAIVNQKAVVKNAQILLSIVALNIYVEFEAVFGITVQQD